jgi:pimeloyl-ACP methyl ester carboxylesterase
MTQTLPVRTVGSEGPAIVLIHGLGTSGDFWDTGYDALASGHQLVVPDLPGFGRRPWPASPCRVDDHAESLASSLGRVRVDDEPAILVAHSLGALVAVALARRRPELVAGVALFAPPLDRDGLARRRTIWRRVRLGSRRRAAAGWAAVAADVPASLAATRVPVQLVIGTKDGRGDLASARSLAAQNPNLGVVAWPHADHDVVSTYPAACRVQIEHLVAGFERSRSPAPRPVGVAGRPKSLV